MRRADSKGRDPVSYRISGADFGSQPAQDRSVSTLIQVRASRAGLALSDDGNQTGPELLSSLTRTISSFP